MGVVWRGSEAEKRRGIGHGLLCGCGGHVTRARCFIVHFSELLAADIAWTPTFIVLLRWLVDDCTMLQTSRSNIRTLPSAPQLTNTSTLLAQKRTSKTSLSCAISCVLAVNDGMSQIVHVVSILEVMIRLGERVFQSRDVRGAVCSGDLELESNAKGVSF